MRVPCLLRPDRSPRPHVLRLFNAIYSTVNLGELGREYPASKPSTDSSEFGEWGENIGPKPSTDSSGFGIGERISAPSHLRIPLISGAGERISGPQAIYGYL